MDYEEQYRNSQKKTFLKSKKAVVKYVCALFKKSSTFIKYAKMYEKRTEITRNSLQIREL